MRKWFGSGFAAQHHSQHARGHGWISGIWGHAHHIRVVVIHLPEHHLPLVFEASEVVLIIWIVVRCEGAIGTDAIKNGADIADFRKPARNQDTTARERGAGLIIERPDTSRVRQRLCRVWGSCVR